MEIRPQIATLGHVQNEHTEKPPRERNWEKWSRYKKRSEGMRRYEKDCVGLEKLEGLFFKAQIPTPVQEAWLDFLT